MSTDYSGIECAGEALRLGLAGLNQLHAWEGRGGLTLRRVSDKARMQRDILLQETADHQPPVCVLGELQERLPAKAREWIASAMPAAGASSAACENAYRDISIWIEKNRSWLYPIRPRSYCHRHNEECPIHPAQHVSVASGDRPLLINCAGVSCLPWSSA
eukprot:3065192-Amphidinium_carterae.1